MASVHSWVRCAPNNGQKRSTTVRTFQRFRDTPVARRYRKNLERSVASH